MAHGASAVEALFIIRLLPRFHFQLAAAAVRRLIITEAT